MNIAKIGSVNNTYFKQSCRNPYREASKPVYDVTHKFGAMRSGKTDYDAVSGNYAVTLRGAIPTVRQKEYYYPKKNIKVTISKTHEGIKKVTQIPTATVTQTYDKTSILKEDKDFSKFDRGIFSYNDGGMVVLDENILDRKNGEISRVVELTSGSRYSLRYDKDLKRKIYIADNEAGRYAVVKDTETGKEITSGERIYDTYTNENGEEVIENILTGKPVQVTKCLNGTDKMDYQIKYYENSENPKYVYQYNTSTGESTERYLTKEGKVTRLEINHISDKSKEIYEYDDDENIISHREDIYGLSLSKKKPVICQIFYNPETGDMEEMIDKKKDGKTITRYSSTEETGENTPITIEYVSHGRLDKLERLQNHGNDLLSDIVFNGINEASYASYDEKGHFKSLNYFDGQGNLTTSLDFAGNGKALASVTMYNSEDNGYEQYLYSGYSKYPINIVKCDNEGNIEKFTLNLDDKNCDKKLSSSYFVNGKFDFDWMNKTTRKGSKLPALPKNRDEALALMDELKEKSETALATRQRNFRRIG